MKKLLVLTLLVMCGCNSSEVTVLSNDGLSEVVVCREGAAIVKCKK